MTSYPVCLLHLIVYLPFGPYSASMNRLKIRTDDPQLGFTRLLHVPSIVRYLVFLLHRLADCLLHWTESVWTRRLSGSDVLQGINNCNNLYLTSCWSKWAGENLESRRESVTNNGAAKTEYISASTASAASTPSASTTWSGCGPGCWSGCGPGCWSGCGPGCWSGCGPGCWSGWGVWESLSYRCRKEGWLDGTLKWI